MLAFLYSPLSYTCTYQSEPRCGCGYNTTAEALSCDIVRSCSRQAAPSPSPIPQTLLDTLLYIQPDWTSCIQLEVNVSLYLGKALARSTLRSYNAGHRIVPGHKFPTTACHYQTIRYVVHLTKEGLSHHTVYKCKNH